MVCWTYVKPKQTEVERREEVRKKMLTFDKRLVLGTIKMKIGALGAVALEGISDLERDGITDLCIYREILKNGSVLAKAALAKAEQIAGRKVAVGAPVHSHDGGKTWHPNHR